MDAYLDKVELTLIAVTRLIETSITMTEEEVQKPKIPTGPTREERRKPLIKTATRDATIIVVTSGLITAIIMVILMNCGEVFRPTLLLLLVLSFAGNVLAVYTQKHKIFFVKAVVEDRLDLEDRLAESYKKRIEGIIFFLKIHHLPAEEQEKELRSILSTEVIDHVRRLIRMKNEE